MDIPVTIQLLIGLLIIIWRDTIRISRGRSGYLSRFSRNGLRYLIWLRRGLRDDDFPALLPDYTTRSIHIYDVYRHLYHIYFNMRSYGGLHMNTVTLGFDFSQDYSWEYLSNILENLIRELDPNAELNPDAVDVDLDQAMDEAGFGGP